MEMDPDDIFRDDDEEAENDSFQERESTKELVVYLVDASPKMFNTNCLEEDGKNVSPFEVALSCISEALKTQIVNKSYDEVAICFFNTREKKNMQDLSGVFVYNVPEREDLDRPTARLIKEFGYLGEFFMKDIGSQYGIISGSRENSLYNAIWASQALLRKGSAKVVDKRILLFTNEDDPFGGIKGVTKLDMMRTTLQRAKDAQDLGILIELLPLNSLDREFNLSLFYADMLGLEGDSIAQFTPLAVERMEDMKLQLKKRMFKKRRYRRITFAIASGLSIELNLYALIRPTVPEKITWLDAATNVPLKSERALICADTGAIFQDAPLRFLTYINQDIKFSSEEITEIKRSSAGPLRLLGFKPLALLKEYHNLRPSTFLYPSDEEMIGSTRVFIALHRSMLRLKRFALAFFGTTARLVALIAQDEIRSSAGQIEPPGMHMIPFPYSDDIRHIEDHFMDQNLVPHASEDQIGKAKPLLKRIDLKDFSVSQFSNPALQKHYAVLQALALEEDDVPEVSDETLPDEEGLSRPGVVKALEEFKHIVYGGSYDEEVNRALEATRKRKATANLAVEKCAHYDWHELAKRGQLKDLTVVELKYYLARHDLPLSGTKPVLVSRIMSHIKK